jgi:hypothetical protein
MKIFLNKEFGFLEYLDKVVFRFIRLRAFIQFLSLTVSGTDFKSAFRNVYISELLSLF